MIWVLTNIYHDDGLLPFFLRYYRERGVDRFGIIYHGHLHLLSAEDIVYERSSEEYSSGPRDNEWILWFKQRHLNSNDWYIPADLDEFYWCPGLRNFKDFIGSWDYVPAKFYDRLASDGTIKPIQLDTPLDIQFPLGGSIIHNLCGGCNDKVAMAQARIDVSSGHHHAPGLMAGFNIMCHHFKWCGESFWAWMNHREALVNYGASKEVTPFREHFKAHNRINIYDHSLDISTSQLIGI